MRTIRQVKESEGGLTAEYPSTPKEILKSVATRLRGYAATLDYE